MGAQTARERLHRLVDLARLYRGWTRKQLAKALGRDPTRVYPDTDNPKADYMLALADALEWSVDEVFEYVYSGLEPECRPPTSKGVSFDSLQQQIWEAYRAGEFPRMLRHAQDAQRVARNAEEYALACNYEFSAWEAMGRYTRALAALRRALSHAKSLNPSVRLLLLSNVALVQMMLGELHAARGCADAILEWFDEHGTEHARDAVTIAFAYTVRGHALRRLIELEPESGKTHAARAIADLNRGRRQFLTLCRKTDNPWFGFYAEWNYWAAADCECRLGKRRPETLVQQTVEELDQVRDLEAVGSRAELLAWGCRCIIAAQVALWHLDPKARNHSVHVLIDKAVEIAEYVGDWALRQQAFSLRYQLHDRLRDDSGLKLDLVMDEEELRSVVGLMGRFPGFRQLGWRILDDAAVLVQRGGLGDAL